VRNVGQQPYTSFSVARRERVISRRNGVLVPDLAVAALDHDFSAAQVCDNFACPVGGISLGAVVRAGALVALMSPSRVFQARRIARARMSASTDVRPGRFRVGRRPGGQPTCRARTVAVVTTRCFTSFPRRAVWSTGAGSRGLSTTAAVAGPDRAAPQCCGAAL
jgi:hypothetical protein